MKNYCLQEKMYIKYPGFNNIFKRVIGTGLGMAEGEIWKRKRRILNKMFNFDYIKSLTPKVAEICDYSIKGAEEEALKAG